MHCIIDPAYSIIGEFGIVYKGHIVKSHRYSIDEYLAIKTLKGNLRLPTGSDISVTNHYTCTSLAYKKA